MTAYMKFVFLLGRMDLIQLAIVISPEDFSNGFKQLSEDLSSSPSGRHIGHYKAALGDVELCTMYAVMYGGTQMEI